MEPNLQNEPIQPTVTPVQSFESKKSFPKWSLIIIGIVLIVILMAGIYFLGQKSALKTQINTQTITKSAPTVTSTPDPTADWKTFTDNQHGISFNYPSDWEYTNSDPTNDRHGGEIWNKQPTNKYSAVPVFQIGYVTPEIEFNRSLTEQEFYNIAGSWWKTRVNKASNTVDDSIQILSLKEKIIEIKSHDIEVDNEPSLFPVNTYSDYDEYFWNNGKIVDLSFTIFTEDKNKMDMIKNQILSTFKFTDQNQTPSISPVVTNNIFEVKELGIEFQIPADLKDLVYTMTNSNGVIAANFSTTSLTSLDQANGGSYCNSTNAGLGIISKSPQLGHDLSDSKQIGSYYYIWNHPQATCSDKSNVYQLQSSQSTALGQAFKTLELIK